MRIKTWLASVGLLILWAGLSGCATTPYTYQGAAAGSALGAVAGALIDDHNRWRGALIGGAIGGVMGGATSEIAARSARQATNHGPGGYRPAGRGPGYGYSPSGYAGGYNGYPW